MNPFLGLIVLGVVILVGSAIATGVEAAILTVSPIQVHNLGQQRVPGARALERIKARPGRALALLVVANNLFNISGSMVLGSHADQVFETGFGGAVGLIAFNVVFTLLVILFAEILPKAIGNNFSMGISLASARMLLVLERLSLPLLLLLEKLMPAITAEAELTTNEREIHLMARLGSQQGQIEADEAAGGDSEQRARAAGAGPGRCLVGGAGRGGGRGAGGAEPGRSLERAATGRRRATGVRCVRPTQLRAGNDPRRSTAHHLPARGSHLCAGGGG
jgi:hypothetical protein